MNGLANGLATEIITAGVIGKNIALLLEHGQSAITGMLGVLKSGNSYVPLDNTYPIERLQYMMEDADCQTLIVSGQMRALAQQLAAVRESLTIIDITDDIKVRSENVGLEIDPERQAYILYTSGSTGQAKGVMQSHRNVLHFTKTYTNNLHISEQDRLSLLPTYSFDASVMDIYGALLNGATLYQRAGTGRTAHLDRRPKNNHTTYHTHHLQTLHIDP